MIEITGHNFIAGRKDKDESREFEHVSPLTGGVFKEAFYQANEGQVHEACTKAFHGFLNYRDFDNESKADFLDNIIGEITLLGEQLIERCHLETALPKERLVGERERACRQIAQFSEHLRRSVFFNDKNKGLLIKKFELPIGPVAVFGASNFPLAFGVLGTDTVSALAAGCSVVVKGNPAHPGTSELLAGAVYSAMKKSKIPPSVFSLIQGAQKEVSKWLVTHPYIQAVGFTGSRKAGRDIFNLCAARENPIPAYAEMGSINPVFMMPDALEFKSKTIASEMMKSITMGVGQFCTNPGVVFVLKSDVTDEFIKEMKSLLAESPAGTMLTEKTAKSYYQGIHGISKISGVFLLNEVKRPGKFQGIPHLFVTDSETFSNNKIMSEEIFGPCSIIVVCKNFNEMLKAAYALEGQLTATIHSMSAKSSDIKKLFEALKLKAGRVVWNGYPTGVEVVREMHHGGPYPAAASSIFTSVGVDSIHRFLRPICFQGVPQELIQDS